MKTRISCSLPRIVLLYPAYQISGQPGIQATIGATDDITKIGQESPVLAAAALFVAKK